MNTTTITIKPANKKSTTMYEVDDSNLKKSYNIDSESRHYEPFYDFIRSLGFDAHKKYEGAGMDTHMVIDGEEFYVNFEKAPYLAKNGWTRETKSRKDRCIELMDRHMGNVIVKIKFNEELDRDKLVNKIQKAIDAKKTWAQEIVDRKHNEMKMLTTMRDHYFKSRIISAYVESIMAHEGALSFNINGASIKVDASTGFATDFTPYEKRDGVIKVANIGMWACEKSDTANVAIKVCKEIVSLGAVSKEFAEYAKKAYHRYVRKNRIEE